MASEQCSTFEVRNGDVSLRFSCKNYGKHLREAIANLRASQDAEAWARVESHFATSDEDVRFYFDGVEQEGKDITRLAVFFENTDYPLRVKALHEGVKIDELYIAGHGSDAASEEDEEEPLIYGTLNFHNQVGRTDMSVNYSVDGVQKKMSFRTEVLSYKMDYRTDLKSIIADIEQEYSMLSYSFLKQTYLSYKEKSGESTDLIWWQIFQQCYKSIVEATKIIINSPKRRLKSVVKNERAERLRNIGSALEQEYAEFQNDPHHLYRTEDMILSKDTVENRFLKYAIKEIHRRFGVVREHIKNTLKVNDATIADNLGEMDEELARLTRHPFFRQIGQFKGFSQDSLVMKRARGYSDIYRNWLLLQCGYELEDGIRKLEVKDVSELYEIWCFIKVKNMVQSILGEDVAAKTSGKQLTAGFIKQLVYGQQSDVKFERDGVELATVSYNAEVEEEDSDMESAIEDTTTFTTVQRPDIVLRLSKSGNDDIVYTYLFDAKYRLADKRIQGDDVPPVDAINQMHRYRDAIYYNSLENGIKREIVGGYVLYPGNLTAEEVRSSYYHDSHEKIGIGAFPLKPGGTIVDEEGNLVLDTMSSESVLYEQIAAWLRNDTRRDNLLEKAIPQKGLAYSDDKHSGISVSDELALMIVLEQMVHQIPRIVMSGKYGIGLDESPESDTFAEESMKCKYAIMHNWNSSQVYRIKSITVVDKTMVDDDLVKRKYMGNERYLTLAIDPHPVETEPLNVKQFSKSGETGRYNPQLVKIGISIKK